MAGFDSSSGRYYGACRRLRYELLEDRRMLAVMADVVFLVDNSSSDGQLTARWLKALVIGDSDNDDIKDTDNLSERLGARGITDVRYGLVAFGEQSQLDSSFRFAHSYLVDTPTAASR